MNFIFKFDLFIMIFGGYLTGIFDFFGQVQLVQKPAVAFDGIKAEINTNKNDGNLPHQIFEFRR